MSREIILSRRASVKLGALLDYLETEWSLAAKRDFIAKLDRALGIISLFPNSFEQVSPERGIHRCVITGQTTVYYRHDENTIHVLTIFDNRQHPGRLTKELG